MYAREINREAEGLGNHIRQLEDEQRRSLEMSNESEQMLVEAQQSLRVSKDNATKCSVGVKTACLALTGAAMAAANYLMSAKQLIDASQDVISEDFMYENQRPLGYPVGASPYFRPT
jgi:hypothetical protein